jgi:glycine cleavage system H protein
MHRYTKSHEWVRVEGNLAYVGISDHAQHEVTDVVYVEVPKTGKLLKAGEEATTIESVKAAFSIYAPVSGTLAKANADLEKDPALINQSPYEKGWMFAIEMSNSKEVESLMTEEQYQAFLKSPEAAGHH